MDMDEKFEWAGRCGCEVPERPLGYGAYVCSRPGCAIALEATLRSYPNLTLVIKWGLGTRTTIPAAKFLELTRESGGDITEVTKFVGRWYEGDPEQYVREVFVMDGTGA